jgi:predicted site-specific integrase-resolvase
MKQEIPYSKMWLTPSEASKYTGFEIHSFRRWAKQGLIRCRINPLRKKQSAWLYSRADIDREILHKIT